MQGQIHQYILAKRTSSRAFLYGIVIAINVLLWILLVAFHWEVSLRAREVAYYGRQLFPLRSQAVPLPVIYGACALLNLISLSTILRDRNNLAAREKLQTLLAQILESLEIGVVVLDSKGYLNLANESARKLLPEIPKRPMDAQYLEVLGDYPEPKEIVKSALDGGGFVKEVEHDLGSRNEPCAARITTLPLKGTHGRINGVLLLVNDVREVVAMERQVRAAERLSTLGTVAAALAHEIRNPLEAMNLNLELLGRSLDESKIGRGDPDRKHKYLRVIESEIARMGKIVDNFLSFVRPSHTPVSNVRLDEILRRVVDLIESQARSRRVDIALDIHGQAITVAGLDDQLTQVFLNLMINSLEAMPDGGRLSVRAEIPAETDAQLRMIAVRIQDTGEGIPPERMARLFDPFFSTRPRGTGLGLTIAQRFVRECRGRILVESVLGKGSTFIVELPLVSIGG